MKKGTEVTLKTKSFSAFMWHCTNSCNNSGRILQDSSVGAGQEYETRGLKHTFKIEQQMRSHTYANHLIYTQSAYVLAPHTSMMPGLKGWLLFAPV